MRRLFPAFMCFAMAAGLSACDNEPTSGPSTPEEEELYNFRAAVFPPIENLPGNGDISLFQPSAEPVPASAEPTGGGDIIVWDFIGVAVYGRTENLVMSVQGTTMVGSSGGTTCSAQPHGLFTELKDSDGAVVYSALGPWVFDGRPQLAGLSAFQQYKELSSRLLYTFAGQGVYDGLAVGDPILDSSESLTFADGMRKMTISALVDGNCGGDGL